jgi:hypothetical protein
MSGTMLDARAHTERSETQPPWQIVMHSFEVTRASRGFDGTRQTDACSLPLSKKHVKFEVYFTRTGSGIPPGWLGNCPPSLSPARTGRTMVSSAEMHNVDGGAYI